MKRFLIALLVGGALFAAVFGAAAFLDVGGGSIQAGSDTTLACDTNGVKVAGWGLETDNGLVYFVRIGGIDASCVSNDLFVNVTKLGVKIGEGSAHIDGTDPLMVTLKTPVKAVDITDLEVFIEGGNP